MRFGSASVFSWRRKTSEGRRCRRGITPSWLCFLYKSFLCPWTTVFYVSVSVLQCDQEATPSSWELCCKTGGLKKQNKTKDPTSGWSSRSQLVDTDGSQSLYRKTDVLLLVCLFLNTQSSSTSSAVITCSLSNVLWLQWRLHSQVPWFCLGYLKLKPPRLLGQTAHIKTSIHADSLWLFFKYK